MGTRYKEPREKICGICGKVYMATTVGQMYCSNECRKESIRSTNIKKYYKYKAREKAHTETNKEVDNVAVRAKKAGYSSYGMYVAACHMKGIAP